MYKYNAVLKRVVDGDTYDLIIDLGFSMTTKQRIRLKGVDTPETWRQKKDSEEYKKGMAAKNYVVKRFQDNNNECIIKTEKDMGVYGRYTAEIIFSDSETSLGPELVQKGHAKVWK